MKHYPTINLTGDAYLNPTWAGHGRAVGSIGSISVHHDAILRPHNYDSAALYRREAADHYKSLGPGLQYHYKIDNVGTIFRIRPLTTWLHVVGSAENTTTIAICLDGYLHNDNRGIGQDPTREQYEALYQLLLELCENHPEFPATWANVRPHSDYGATACCGNRFAPQIYAIQNRDTAKAQLLNRGVYDWPDLQPNAPKPTPVVPAPVTTPPAMPIPPTVIINYRVFGGDGKQVGAYTLDTNAWNKYQTTIGAAIKDQDGNDVTAQLKAKFSPPPKKPTDDHSKINERLSALEATVKLITDFLDSIFNWKKK